MPSVEQFTWSEFSKISDKSGIYAWYYNPEITTHDLETAINKINSQKSKDDAISGKQTVRNFLQDHIFQHFREEPFAATITGALKPFYKGKLEHQPPNLESLINRIYESPDRLHEIKATLEMTAPYFASPMYIGMSDNLKSRIWQHKNLIEKFRSQISNPFTAETISDDDAGFARQIAARRIPPGRLLVVTCTTATIGKLAGNTHVDIENILNRIYYPILGRN